jgi:hypothetical protein
VPAIVVEHGIGSASGDFDRVEQEFEMSRDIHGVSVCCPLNRKTIEAIFLFSQASSRWLKTGSIWVVRYTIVFGVLPAHAPFLGKIAKRGSSPVASAVFVPHGYTLRELSCSPNNWDIPLQRYRYSW